MGQNLEMSKHALNVSLAKLIQSYWFKNWMWVFFPLPPKEKVPSNETKVFNFWLETPFSPISNIWGLCEIKKNHIFFILDQSGVIIVFTFQISVTGSKDTTVCTVLAILQDISGTTTLLYMQY